MLESTLMLEVKTNKNPKGQSLIITLTLAILYQIIT